MGRGLRADGRTEGGGMRVAEERVLGFREAKAGADCRERESGFGRGILEFIGAGVAFLTLIPWAPCFVFFDAVPFSTVENSRAS